MRVVGGVDCHKSTHTVVFVDQVGHIRASLTFPTNARGYEQALSAAAKLRCTEWGVEGSGLYGFAFAVFAAASGAKVLEVPGSFTKRQRRSSSRRGKSDEIDAKAIAETVLREEGRLSEFCLATTQRGLRLRYDQRDRLVRERTNAVNRLRSSALLLGISRLPTGMTPTRNASKLAGFARKLRAAGDIDCATAAVLDDVEDAADNIVRLNAKIKNVEAAIRPLVRAIAPELLSLRGVSDVSAAGLIGHAGDLKNIRNAAAFAMRCGTAPVELSSGRRTAVRVNPGGDRQLNRLLHTAAMSQVRQAQHPGRVYYDRKRAEGKTHLAAMRCLKRTLATIVYYRLRETDKRLRNGLTDSMVAA